MYLDETVIFFTEHSMKLYAVVDGAKLFFFPCFFIALFSAVKQYILFGFLRVLPFAVVSPHIKWNQNVMSFAAVITL